MPGEQAMLEQAIRDATVNKQEPEKAEGRRVRLPDKRPCKQLIRLMQGEDNNF